MTLNVDHCKRCGKVFQVAFSPYCPDCITFVRTELERCSAYLRKNLDSTLGELSQATEVPIQKIIHYINEGKLYVLDYPNLGYPCYFCGNEIKRGYLCPDCACNFKLEVKDLYLKEGYMYDEATQQVKHQSGNHLRREDTYTVELKKHK